MKCIELWQRPQEKYCEPYYHIHYLGHGHPCLCLWCRRAQLFSVLFALYFVFRVLNWVATKQGLQPSEVLCSALGPPVQKQTQYSRCVFASAECRGKILSLLLHVALFLTWARMLLAFLGTWAQVWLPFNWLSTNTPGSFPARKSHAKLCRRCWRLAPKWFRGWLAVGFLFSRAVS